MANFSKTQIDRLGDRLKKGSHTESDLRLLDDYRRSFGDAYRDVVRIIRERDQFPTGRSAKWTDSIVEKLRRESIRLSQMQDIAGCRVVVVDVMEQERVVASLRAAFPGATVLDRRANPSYGYRAVHIIAEMYEKPIEIQVRSSLQHRWAELSEKSSDVLDPTIKYGGGPDSWRSYLTILSEEVAAYEKLEKAHSEAEAAKEEADAAYEKFKKTVANLGELHVPDHELRRMRVELEVSTREMERRNQEIREMRAGLVRHWNECHDVMSRAISWLDDQKRKEQ